MLQADHADTGRMGQDWRDRARDMSFVIDSLAEIESKAPGLASKMDATRIGVGGHLIGAYAAVCAGGDEGGGLRAGRTKRPTSWTREWMQFCCSVPTVVARN